MELTRKQIERWANAPEVCCSICAQEIPQMTDLAALALRQMDRIEELEATLRQIAGFSDADLYGSQELARTALEGE